MLILHKIKGLAAPAWCASEWTRPCEATKPIVRWQSGVRPVASANREQTGLLARFLFLFDLDDLFTLVRAAVGTDMMRSPQVVAVGAFGQVRALQRKMAAAAIPPALGQFPLW